MSKRTLTTAVSLLLCALYIAAQDVIITLDEKRIEAKITEVSDTEIKYRNPNIPDGPQFVMGVDKLNTIIYSNGTVKVFTHAQTEQPAAASPQKTVYIDKFSDHYLMGDKRMNEDEYMKFLKQHCPEAYKSHESGKKLANAGWVCLGTGAVLGVVGSALWATSYDHSYGGAWIWGEYDKHQGKGLTGVVFTSAGAALLTISVPLLAVGYARKNKSHVIYNNYCARQNTPVALTLKAKTDGMAVAINF